MYEKQSRNSNRSSDTIASFLLKTYQILQHPQYERMISWDKSNVGFIIHDVVSFTRQILPKYFRHSNFSSFVRQLNMYDFHKVKQQNQSLVFKNPLFCKGEQQNLKFIRRKAAKKVGGQRKQQINDRTDAENEKYENLLKGFKKSFQSEINHSSFFYERSIQLMKELNESSIKKQSYIGKLYVNDEQYETTEQAKEGKEKMEGVDEKRKIERSDSQEQRQKKDTIIQIPRQFLTPQQPEQQKENKVAEGQEKQVKKMLNMDRVMQLKEQVYKSLGVYQSWLQEYIEINKKKVKYISSSRQQLIKCRQNKSNENQENNYGMNEGENDRPDSNQENVQQQEHNEQRLVSLQFISERQQYQNANEECQKPEVVNSSPLKEDKANVQQQQIEALIVVKSEVKSVLPIIRLFDQQKSVEKNTDNVNGNGNSNSQQSGFLSMNETFSTRLFSTFSKPNNQKTPLPEQSEQSACDDENSNKSYQQEINENQNQI